MHSRTCITESRMARFPGRFAATVAAACLYALFPLAASSQTTDPGAGADETAATPAAGFPASSVAAPGSSPSGVSPSGASPSGVSPSGVSPAPARPARADLLSRLRTGLSLPIVADRAVATERDWYIRHPDYLARVFARADTYLHFIVEAIEERDMPLDLALLPIVESAFDPFAYSHGRASGLWQIIPGTGRRLGLKQNWWFDGRRDIAESTRAALDYLQMLHEMFDGDWLLAVAGYNSGEGNVARAVRRARAAGRPTDFWNIRSDLPRETRAYVPRLIAIRDIVADPERHGVTLPRIEDAPVFTAIDTVSQIDLALAAELAEVEIDRLYALNPGINRWATDPEGPHRLFVPLDAGPKLAAALRTLDESERVRWTRHRIGNGETLSGIATRYGTTTSVLREINGISGSMIRAGQHLMIPHAVEGADSYRQSLDARSARQRDRERAGTRITHAVQAGESFWTISRQYGVGMRELASWNAMAPGDTLSVGRDLVVWTKSSSAAVSPGQVRRINYVVRRGDSLASIAQRFRVSVSQLVQWNGIDPQRYLQPGQRLVMHVDVTEQSS